MLRADDLSKGVVTESFRRAARALDIRGLVHLFGEPAVGKTTMASLLAMAYPDKWSAEVVKAFTIQFVQCACEKRCPGHRYSLR